MTLVEVDAVGTPADRPPLTFTAAEREALHALAFVYLKHGYPRRALNLLALIDRDHPDDPAILRTLAYAWLSVGDGEQALWILDRLQRSSSLVEPSLLLLESRALLQAGRLAEARHRFRLFLAMRRALPAEPAGGTGVTSFLDGQSLGSSQP